MENKKFKMVGLKLEDYAKLKKEKERTGIPMALILEYALEAFFAKRLAESRKIR